MKEIKTLSVEDKPYTEKDKNEDIKFRTSKIQEIRNILNKPTKMPRSKEWQKELQNEWLIVDAMIDEIMSKGIIKKIPLTKEELKKLPKGSSATVFKKYPLTRDEVCILIYPISSPDEKMTLEMIKKAISNVIYDETKMDATNEHNLSAVNLAIDEAYALGKNEMMKTFLEYEGDIKYGVLMENVRPKGGLGKRGKFKITAEVESIIRNYIQESIGKTKYLKNNKYKWNHKEILYSVIDKLSIDHKIKVGYRTVNDKFPKDAFK